MGIVVKKFGGATLEDSQKIKAIAKRLAEEKQCGDDLVVVVSAMGKSTDALIRQVQEVSPRPEPREVDLLLSTGELASAALLSIALNDLGCPAVSLTGMQAGIMTNASHACASIESINGFRVEESLKQNKVVILAGFQGMNHQGDTTTLGRGGSDTTALAIAARLQADRCEILKDFPAVYDADPRVVADARPISNLSYDALLDMTYWGAKVLQYRSVEIAKNFAVPLYVGPAHSKQQGTVIGERNKMIEGNGVLALNSHESIVQIFTQQNSLSKALIWLSEFLQANHLSAPQLVHSEKVEAGIALFVTGPSELLESILLGAALCPSMRVQELCSVTATCQGTTRPELLEKIVGSVERNGMNVLTLLVSSMSVTLFLEAQFRERAIQCLYKNLFPRVSYSPLTSVAYS